MKYLNRDAILALIKDVGLDNAAQEKVVSSMDNMVDEALTGAVAKIKKSWYKPETHKVKIGEAVATAKKKWEKEVKEQADKTKKENAKFAEREKALGKAGFVMTDYRKELVKKMAIDEPGDKEFNAFMADLKKTGIKASAANRPKGKGFKPDVGGGNEASIELAI